MAHAECRSWCAGITDHDLLYKHGVQELEEEQGTAFPKLTGLQHAHP